MLIEAQVKDAFIVRLWSENTLTERIRMRYPLLFNGGSNDSSEGGFGEILYFIMKHGMKTVLDVYKIPMKSANVSARIRGFGDSFRLN